MSRMLDDRIIEGLLNAPSIAQAARDAGCSRECIYQHLRDPDFAARLEQELKARRKARNSQASAAVEAAIQALRETLDNPLGVSKRDTLKAVELALKYLQR